MALANREEVEDLADSLTECADSIHERLMRAIKSKEIGQAEAQEVFQDETTLRQRANSLYIDAIKYVVNGLEEAQANLVGTVDTAKAKIQTIQKMAEFIDLAADLLALATAAYSAKPGLIVAALKEVKNDIEAL
jgi:hypothetical protein